MYGFWFLRNVIDALFCLAFETMLSHVLQPLKQIQSSATSTFKEKQTGEMSLYISQGNTRPDET